MDSLINYGSDSEDDDEQQLAPAALPAHAAKSAATPPTATSTLPQLSQLLHTLPAPTKKLPPSALLKATAAGSLTVNTGVVDAATDVEQTVSAHRPAPAAATTDTQHAATPAASTKPTTHLKSLFELLPPAQNSSTSSASTSRHHHYLLLPASKKRKRRVQRSDDDTLSVSSPELDPLQTLDDEVMDDATGDDDNIAIDPQLLKSLQEQAALQFNDELPAEQPANGYPTQPAAKQPDASVEHQAHHHIDPSRAQHFAHPPQQQPPPSHSHAADKMWRQFADATSDAVEINANDLTRRNAADAALLTLEREKAAAAEKDKAFSAKLYNARAGEEVSTGKVSSTQRRTHHINQVAAQSAQLELEMQRRKAMGQQQKQRAKNKYGW